MATRYSGTLVLSIRYVDATSSYTVRIRERNDDARFATLTGLRLAPIHSNLAVDSARAYDLAAAAALSFASNDDEAIGGYACHGDPYDDAWWHIARRASEAFGRKWAVSP